MTTVLPAAGLQDPVHDAQRGFRGVLDAMARPGTIQAIGEPIAGLPLGPALAHLLLTLTDEDTPVWWQSAHAQLREWLRFHTGARSVPDAGDATFAVAIAPAHLPRLDCFRTGSPQAPEQSCTVLLEVPSLREGPAVRARGPGIRDMAALHIAGLPTDFWAQWQANHAAFPQGVDMVFTCGRELLALPRSTRIGYLHEV